MSAILLSAATCALPRSLKLRPVQCHDDDADPPRMAYHHIPSSQANSSTGLFRPNQSTRLRPSKADADHVANGSRCTASALLGSSRPLDAFWKGLSVRSIRY